MKDHEQKERRNAKVEPTPEVDPDFPNKTRNFVLASLVAIVAMAVFATSTGIVQVDPQDLRVYDLSTNTSFH